jgi:hypothetical protein
MSSVIVQSPEYRNSGQYLIAFQRKNVLNSEGCTNRIFEENKGEKRVPSEKHYTIVTYE